MVINILPGVSRQITTREFNMEFIQIKDTPLKSSRIGLGTWAIGGWLWGGTEEKESISTILKAVELGVNLIDTAPVYGFGLSEELVGRALKEHGKREDFLIATKCGLQWDQGGVSRNSSPERIEKEINDSLQRLNTDYIDLYQVHWPDEATPFAKTAECLAALLSAGKIRAIGVSNFSPNQMNEFKQGGPLHSNQPPYNLFERGIEEEVLPYSNENNIATLAYGAICRGLLSGRMQDDTTFEGDDIRKNDPKFQGERYKQYLIAVKKLDEFARENFQKRVIHLAVRWLLEQPGDMIALWGARRPEQLALLPEIFNWQIPGDAMDEIDSIVKNTVTDPVGPEFMGPPRNSPV